MKKEHVKKNKRMRNLRRDLELQADEDNRCSAFVLYSPSSLYWLKSNLYADSLHILSVIYCKVLCCLCSLLLMCIRRFTVSLNVRPLCGSALLHEMLKPAHQISVSPNVYICDVMSSESQPRNDKWVHFQKTDWSAKYSCCVVACGRW